MKKSKNMHIVMHGKTCICKTCQKSKPLDVFVRKIEYYTGKSRQYECIDCKVNRLFYQDNIKIIPEKSDKKIKFIDNVKGWINAKV